MRPEFGEIVRDPARLDEALLAMLGDEELRRRCGAAAQAYAMSQRFEETAARLARLLGGY
jgi:hypothetical protein